MTLNTKFLPTIGMKIRSSFNNARKSNVGFSSCEIMKRVYRNATLEKLNNKIEIKEGQIKDLKSNISTLEDDMQSKLNESSDFYTAAQGVLENTDDVEDKVQINKEIASAQNSFNKDMGKINKKIISEQKKLSRAEEGLSVFEQLRKEAEKQEIERQEAENQEAEKQEKTENVKEIKETDDLRKQQYDSEKAIFDIFHKNIDSDDQSENLNDAESSVEVTNNSVEKKEDNMENLQIDPIENLKNAFNNFISQISKERKEYKKENTKLKETNDSLNKQIEDATQISQEIGQEAANKVNEANNIIRSEKAKIQNLMEQVKNLKVENNTLKTEKDNLTQENATLKSDKENLAQENEQLKNENTEIKAENKSLSEEISSMKEKQDRMSEELSTIRTQFTSMTNIINQFSSGTSEPEMEGHSPYVKQ